METSHLRRAVFALIVLKSPPILPLFLERKCPERDFRRRVSLSSSSGRGFAASRPHDDRPTHVENRTSFLSTICLPRHFAPFRPSSSFASSFFFVDRIDESLLRNQSIPLFPLSSPLSFPSRRIVLCLKKKEN